jgi:hypothetical protein
VAAQLVGACGLDVSGLQDVGVRDDAGGWDVIVPLPPHDATFDTSVDTGGGTGDDTGGAVDAAMGNDAAGGDDGAPADGRGTVDAPPADACTPTGPEDCTNGIDDNCDGLTDCADPACMQQQYTCVAPPPGGWKFVAFDLTAQPGCPTALQPASVDVDPSENPAQCSCTCGVGTPPTCTGDVTAASGNAGSCATMGAQFRADGSCNKVPVTVNAYAQVSQPAGRGGTCLAMQSTMTPPTGATQGQICGGENKYGAGCSNGQVCALVPSAFQACVAKGGSAPCPAGDYGTPHFVGNLKDTRTCSPCQCGGTPSCALTWNFYDSPSCQGTVALTLNPDGTCQPTGGPHTYTSNSLTGNAQNATCGAPTMPPTPIGQVTLDAEQTVCCQ